MIDGGEEEEEGSACVRAQRISFGDWIGCRTGFRLGAHRIPLRIRAAGRDADLISRGPRW